MFKLETTVTMICTESTDFCEKYTVSSQTQQGLHENLNNSEIDSLSTPAYRLKLSLDPQDSPEDPPRGIPDGTPDGWQHPRRELTISPAPALARQLTILV